MRILRSSNNEITIIEKEHLFDTINDFGNYKNYDFSQPKGQPYSFHYQNLIENFIEENHYISIIPLLQTIISLNKYPNKFMIELLLNTCFNCNDVNIVNEACNIIENIACIPGIYDYEKLNNSDKSFILNKELPFDFITNEKESFFFNNIIYIMKNSLGNIEGYEKLNKDDEPNETMEEINRVFFNIVPYKETRKINNPEFIYLFFHTIIIILKNDILQNQSVMKKTMLFRIIKNINLNKLISNICELYDYTTYYDYDKIPLIQSDIQQFIYMISLYSYTKCTTFEDEKNYLISREDLINKLYSNITERMLLPFIETMIDNKVKQGIIERILQNKCKGNVSLYTKLNEDKIIAYFFNFKPKNNSYRSNLVIIRSLFLLIQSYLIDYTLTEEHQKEWMNVLEVIDDRVNLVLEKPNKEPEEIKYKEELLNYNNLLKILIMNNL